MFERLFAHRSSGLALRRVSFVGENDACRRKTEKKMFTHVPYWLSARSPVHT